MNIFIITPFSKNFDDIKILIKEITEPLIGENGRCIRLDDIEESGKITDDLIKYINDSDICIADITNNNPNVMWEVGYAMALGKRIIFISQDIKKLPFDIRIMRTLEYDRNSLSNTLKQQLKSRIEKDIEIIKKGKITINNIDVNSKNSNPKIESLSRLVNDIDSDDILHRGQFTEFLADSTLSIGSIYNPMDIFQELHHQIFFSSDIDLKYHYLGIIGATNWLNLSNDPKFEHNTLKKIITHNFKEIINIISSKPNSNIDFVSLGPGDGEIDKNIIYEFLNQDILNYYYCIDISFELLQKAVSTITSSNYLKNKIKLKAIHGDFSYLNKYKPIYAFDKFRNIFSFIGFTFGNYQEAQILGKIKEGMNIGDYLLIDARLHQLGKFSDITEFEKNRNTLCENYHLALNYKFALSPLELSTDLVYDEVKDEFGIDVNQTITSVPHSINLITYLKLNDNKKIKLRYTNKVVKNKKLSLASTTLYDYDSLKNWFETRGFSVVWQIQSNKIGLFLLVKK